MAAREVEVSSSSPLFKGFAASLVAVLGVWTGLIVWQPFFRFHVFLPEARRPLETAVVVILALTCGLAYVRHSLIGSVSLLLTSLAFLVLALNEFAFTVIAGPDHRSVTGQQELYFWTAGSLLAGILLLFAMTPRAASAKSRRPGVAFALSSLAVTGVLTLVQAMLWISRTHLPPLSSVKSGVLAASFRGALPGLSITDYALGLTGVGLYLGAALIPLIQGKEATVRWLSLAMVLAAFSHLDYMVFPTMGSGLVSDGDFLRLAFSSILLAGLVWEVRRTYRAEKKRTAQFELALAAERSRVEDLERLDRSRAELFNILTHELLHPVAAIRGFAVTLAHRWTSFDEERRREMTELIYLESGRLRDLAEEAATVVNLEAEAFSIFPREASAVELARQAAEAVGELDSRLKVRIETGVDEVVLVLDHARILQLLRNLLTNAEKYSEPGTPIELRVERVQGGVKFSVTNEGQGIATEDMPRLFQRFSRIRAPGQEHIPGSGLGLYIARRIVEAHGGSIWAECVPGEQTSFSFTLSEESA